jgi:hypothetical protein
MLQHLLGGFVRCRGAARLDLLQGLAFVAMTRLLCVSEFRPAHRPHEPARPETRIRDCRQARRGRDIADHGSRKTVYVKDVDHGDEGT